MWHAIFLLGMLTVELFCLQCYFPKPALIVTHTSINFFCNKMENTIMDQLMKKIQIFDILIVQTYNKSTPKYWRKIYQIICAST